MKLEDLSLYKYVGTLVTSDDDAEKDINTRIGMAAVTFCKPKALMMENLKHWFIEKIAEFACISLLSNGGESWTLKKKHKKNSFEQWCVEEFWKILFERENNQWKVLNRMETNVKSRRNITLHMLAFAGLVKRVLIRMLIKTILEVKIDGKWYGGRSRRKWINNIKLWVSTESYRVVKKCAEQWERWWVMIN